MGVIIKKYVDIIKTKENEWFLQECEDEYKLCQYCPHGYIIYSDNVETKEDLDGACFETICTLNDIKEK